MSEYAKRSFSYSDCNKTGKCLDEPLIQVRTDLSVEVSTKPDEMNCGSEIAYSILHIGLDDGVKLNMYLVEIFNDYLTTFTWKMFYYPPIGCVSYECLLRYDGMGHKVGEDELKVVEAIKTFVREVLKRRVLGDKKEIEEC